MPVTDQELTEAVWAANDLLTDLRYISCRAAGEQRAQGIAHDPAASVIVPAMSRVYAENLRQALVDIEGLIDVYNLFHDFQYELYYDRTEEGFDLHIYER